MSGRVIVVGSTNTDLVVPCHHLPQAGETVLGCDLQTFSGGKGANQAVAAARAGAKVHFVGAFGDDAFGAARKADLEREGIHCAGCVVRKGVASGVALIAVGAGKDKAKAENLIIVAPGANARLTPKDVRRGLPKGLGPRDVLVVSLEVPLDSVHEAMHQVWERGGTVILNPAPFPATGSPSSLLEWCHFITPNETEFQQFAGVRVGHADAPVRIAALGRKGLRPPDVLVTRGPKGVDLYRSQDISDLRERIRLAARRNRLHVRLPRAYESPFARAPKVKAVDTVGAGDCFNGSLAARLAEDPQDLQAAADYAVAAAALKVTRHGAQSGMPRRNEVLRFMRRR